MTAPLEVTRVAWTYAGVGDVERGLIAYLEVELAGSLVVACTLRRTAAGRYAVSFPTRTDRRGQRHALVRAVDAATRRELERQVLRHLGLDADRGTVTP